MKLIQSKVQYDREAHTYTLDGVRLCGVTSMLKYQLQPNSYANIPKSVLEKAAAKGSAIHDACETYDNFGVIGDDYHVADYARMVGELGWQHEVSEYVVTDGKYFASPIDKVYRIDDNTVIIGDIKTISKMGEEEIEKVTWQTSIYACWLEDMNPGMTVDSLFVIWLPDLKYQNKTNRPIIKRLERIPREEVEMLLQAEVNDEKYRDNSVRRSEREGYSASVTTTDPLVPAEVAALNNYVIEVLRYADEAEKMKKEMTEKVREVMAANNIKKWDNEYFSFSLGADSERRTFDVNKLKEIFPNEDFDDEKFYKISKVKGAFKCSYKK